MFWKHQIYADIVMSTGTFSPVSIGIIAGGVTSSQRLSWTICHVWPVPVLGTLELTSRDSEVLSEQKKY